MARKQDDPRGKQQGAQQHAEGQHGERAHAHLRDEIQSEGRPERTDVEQRDASRAGEHPADGGHRLFEGRKQHDEAEKNSEKNRREIDIDRHGHDRDEIPPPGGQGGGR